MVAEEEAAEMGVSEVQPELIEVVLEESVRKEASVSQLAQELGQVSPCWSLKYFPVWTLFPEVWIARLSARVFLRLVSWEWSFLGVLFP